MDEYLELQKIIELNNNKITELNEKKRILSNQIIVQKIELKNISKLIYRNEIEFINSLYNNMPSSELYNELPDVQIQRKILYIIKTYNDRFKLINNQNN
jgi:hypothetical protein